jgi:hypothetical protein
MRVFVTAVRVNGAPFRAPNPPARPHLAQRGGGQVRRVAQQRDAPGAVHLAVARLAEEQRVLRDRAQLGAAQQLQHVRRPAALRLRQRAQAPAGQRATLLPRAG